MLLLLLLFLLFINFYKTVAMVVVVVVVVAALVVVVVVAVVDAFVVVLFLLFAPLLLDGVLKYLPPIGFLSVFLVNGAVMKSTNLCHKDFLTAVFGPVVVVNDLTLLDLVEFED